MESIAIKCSNFDRIAGLLLNTKIVKESINKIKKDTKLHRVGLSWIIYSSKHIKYYIKENNHLDWLNKGPRYNAAICWA